MVVVLVDNSYGPGGPGMVLAGVLVVRVGNSYGPGGPGVVLAVSCVGVSVECTFKWGVRKSASEVSPRRIRACL